MKVGTTVLSLITALSLTAAPIASASAHGWDHGHRGGWGPGPIAAVAGAVGALIAAPFVLAGELASPVVVAPAPVAYAAPVYAAPAPVAYGYPAVYPAPVYAYPTAAVGYAAYYGGPRGYYGYRGR